MTILNRDQMKRVQSLLKTTNADLTMERDTENALLADCRQQLDTAKETINSTRLTLNAWIESNAPGGWIDDMRLQRDRLAKSLKWVMAVCSVTYTRRLRQNLTYCDGVDECRAALSDLEPR